LIEKFISISNTLTHSRFHFFPAAPLLLELPCFPNSVTPSLLSPYFQLRELQKNQGVFPGLVFRLETKGSALYSL
jgi:hypothetical protein